MVLMAAWSRPGLALPQLKMLPASSRMVHLPKRRAEHQVRSMSDKDLACPPMRTSSFVESLLAWTRSSEPEALLDKLPVVSHPGYGDVEDWDPKHRFVMSKFGGMRNAIESTPHLKEEVEIISDFEPVSASTLCLVHDRKFVDDFCEGRMDPKAMRRIGLPWSPSLVRRTLLEVQGTTIAAKLALERRLACNAAGGTHHAYADYGSGFTIFNDLAVTAAWLRAEKLANRVLILDLDVHQGDGTAAIHAGNPDIMTVSVHCASNFPFRKQQSDMDIALEDEVGDRDYLQRLSHFFPSLLADFKPDIVLYDAGVDVHAEDELGKLHITTQGLFDRDVYVLRTCLAMGVPVATVIGGGYDRDHLVLAKRHAIIVQAAVACRQWTRNDRQRKSKDVAE